MARSIPVSINGKPCTLALDLLALLTLDKEFGISREKFGAELKRKDRTSAEELELLMTLTYCMTRSNDEPPTLKDVQRMDAAEILRLQTFLHGVVKAAHDGGVGPSEGKGSAVPAKPAAGSARSGTGGGRSKLRRNAGSSRRSSGG